jgi:hypothetical protein
MCQSQIWRERGLANGGWVRVYGRPSGGKPEKCLALSQRDQARVIRVEAAASLEIKESEG